MRHSSAMGKISAVEELEEVLRSSGWDGDFRQISKGRFSTERAFLEDSDISLRSVNFKNKLQIVARGSPEGFIAMLLPRITLGRVTMLGTTLADGGLVFMPNGSEVDFVVSAGTGNETILVPEEEFRAIARAIAPAETAYFPEATSIYQADPLRFAPVRGEINVMLRAGCLDTEAVSRLLAMLVLWITDTAPGKKAEQLRNGRAAAIARRARDFVEDNYRNKVRLEDICTHTEVGMRTLQRYFASYFQVSLFEYIKVRRLNEARRGLLAADPSYASVTEIAISNGLSHLGRFSTEYRVYFGESPSETLAARKPIVVVQ